MFEASCLILKISLQTGPISGRALGDVVEQERAILTSGMTQLSITSAALLSSCIIWGSITSIPYLDTDTTLPSSASVFSSATSTACSLHRRQVPKQDTGAVQ